MIKKTLLTSLIVFAVLIGITYRNISSPIAVDDVLIIEEEPTSENSKTLSFVEAAETTDESTVVTTTTTAASTTTTQVTTQKMTKENTEIRKPVTTTTLVDTNTTKATFEEIEEITNGGVKLAKSVKTISTLSAPSDLKLDENNVPISYKKRITGTASAYSGGGITATGASARPGYIAVNPKQIPYHTKMWIVLSDGTCYGYSSAEDTGGFINWTGNRATLCDLYFPTNSQCNKFGRQTVTIYIL